jgi:hypothetical protein
MFLVFMFGIKKLLEHFGGESTMLELVHDLVQLKGPSGVVKIEVVDGQNFTHG